MAVLLTAILVPGCFGLSSSTTWCKRSDPTDEGIVFVVDDPGRFEGHCARLSGDIDEVLRKVPADGRVHFPVPAGSYYITVKIVDPDDNYCTFDRFAHNIAYNGTGLLVVHAEPRISCA